MRPIQGLLNTRRDYEYNQISKLKEKQMKTFETRKIIKEHNMFGEETKKEVSQEIRSMKIEEPIKEVPSFVESKSSVKGQSDIFEAKLSKQLTKTKGITFSDGIHKVEMIPLISSNSKGTLLDDGKLLFQFFNGIDDLQYSLKETGLKEEIIVHEKRNNYVFEFELKLTGLVPQLIDGEKIILVDETSGEEVFKIADLIMVDAAGTKSKSITLSLTDGLLTMTCNNAWINDEDRVLPIIIDPQIEVITRPLVDLLCFNQNDVRVFTSSGDYTIGRVSSTSKNYAKFIINCKKVLQISGSQTGKFTISFSNEKGVINSSTPKRFKVTVNNELLESGIKFADSGRYSIDITKFVLAQQEELIVRIDLDEISGQDIENFILLGFASPNEESRPAIRCETIDVGEAIETATLDKTLSQDDSISVDLHDGNYLYSYKGPTIKNKALKLGLNFVHSSIKRTNDEIKDAHIGGIKTNLHQYLIKSSSTSNGIETKKAFYIDGNNRSHELYERWFYESSTGIKTFVNKSMYF